VIQVLVENKVEREKLVLKEKKAQLVQLVLVENKV
jgi:hypothetical protein